VAYGQRIFTKYGEARNSLSPYSSNGGQVHRERKKNSFDSLSWVGGTGIGERAFHFFVVRPMKPKKGNDSMQIPNDIPGVFWLRKVSMCSGDKQFKMHLDSNWFTLLSQRGLWFSRRGARKGIQLCGTKLDA